MTRLEKFSLPPLPAKPPAGTAWSRLTGAERKAAALHAAAAGARALGLAIDYCTNVKAVSGYLLRAREQIARDKAAVTDPLKPKVRYVPTGPGKPIMELTSQDCRWPLWADGPMPPEPERFYCGGVTEPDSRWCTACRPHATRGSSFLFTMPMRRGTTKR